MKNLIRLPLLFLLLGLGTSCGDQNPPNPVAPTEPQNQAPATRSDVEAPNPPEAPTPAPQKPAPKPAPPAPRRADAPAPSVASQPVADAPVSSAGNTRVEV